jgi:hypothetical protein
MSPVRLSGVQDASCWSGIQVWIRDRQEEATVWVGELNSTLNRVQAWLREVRTDLVNMSNGYRNA